MREQLLALPKATILDLFKALNNGSVGFDHERTKKTECVDRLLNQWPQEDIRNALSGVVIDVEADAAPAKPAQVKPSLDQSAVAQQIAGLFATLAAGAVNEDRVRSIVAEAVKTAIESSPVTVIDVKRSETDVVRVEGYRRKEYTTILRRASRGRNILLIGPAGCGKTHLAQQVAKDLGREFASVSCTAGMSESALSGWLIPSDGGKFVFIPSDFVRLYEGGGVFLFDEGDAADSNTLLFINQALANGHFYLPQREGNSKVTRHAEFVAMMACNTYGTGGNMIYAGRERLDESTLDRFRAGAVVLGYDTAFERQVVAGDLLEWGWKVRQRIADCGLSRVMSTRFLLDASDNMAAGESLAEVKETFFIGWKADERKKVEA